MEEENIKEIINQITKDKIKKCQELLTNLDTTYKPDVLIKSYVDTNKKLEKLEKEKKILENKQNILINPNAEKNKTNAIKQEERRIPKFLKQYLFQILKTITIVIILIKISEVVFKLNPIHTFTTIGYILDIVFGMGIVLYAVDLIEKVIDKKNTNKVIEEVLNKENLEEITKQLQKVKIEEQELTKEKEKNHKLLEEYRLKKTKLVKWYNQLEDANFYYNRSKNQEQELKLKKILEKEKK